MFTEGDREREEGGRGRKMEREGKGEEGGRGRRGGGGV